MQVPKLVAFDVDGTLIGWDGQMTAATAATLQMLRDREIPIAVATGRPFALAERTLAQVGGADWIACGNGAVLSEVSTGALLRDNNLADDVVEPLIRGLRSAVPGVGFAIELARVMVEEPGFGRRVPEDSIHPPVDDVLVEWLRAPEPVRRVIPFHDDYDGRLGGLAEIVRRFIDHRCKVQFGGLPIIDVAPQGNHKAAALQVLVDHLSMAASDVMAFGDGTNDVEMLEWAGTGVAMGNANPIVQERADAVTEPVDQGGISHILDPLLNGAGLC